MTTQAKRAKMLRLKVGSSFNTYHRHNSPANMKYHVRGFVDGKVVIRHWVLTKQRWVYEVWEGYILRIWHEQGIIRNISHKRVPKEGFHYV